MPFSNECDVLCSRENHHGAGELGKTEPHSRGTLLLGVRGRMPPARPDKGPHGNGRIGSEVGRSCKASRPCFPGQGELAKAEAKYCDGCRAGPVTGVSGKCGPV